MHCCSSLDFNICMTWILLILFDCSHSNFRLCIVRCGTLVIHHRLLLLLMSFFRRIFSTFTEKQHLIIISISLLIDIAYDYISVSGQTSVSGRTMFHTYSHHRRTYSGLIFGHNFLRFSDILIEFFEDIV